ncbi:glycosyltransferase family 2 protein [Lacticaseibacillus rhamnosus]|uniref:glycosyltransferase family 2 protein n=1 Tax=Lacticaseibacillus rhamnosus TaxID=47715 RepID=UPI0028165070|nr:glycosyltransferase [Lacticaseibacillus rhamnosus]
MTVFVILNYLTVSETIETIREIESMGTVSIKIIVVDNASPNGAGKKLQNSLKSDPKVRVVQNSENVGFARGNNLGYKLAKEYDPDFVIMQNNDIQYIQSNFLELVKTEYSESGFDILGPDILVPETGIHQNPKRRSSYSSSDIHRILQMSERKLKNKKRLAIRAFFKQFVVIRKIVLKLKARKQRSLWKERLKGPILHGSCLIFSKNFLNRIPEPFDPRTFFYFETEILDLRLANTGMLVIYNPNLHVLHHQNTSTKMASKDELQKTIFQLENMIKSGRVAESYFK